jgi:hypothetical protein
MKPYCHAAWRAASSAILATSFGVAACDSADAGDPAGQETAASASHVASTCEAQCDYDDRCSADGRADNCIQSCTARWGLPSVVSQRALEVYAECMRDPACLDEDDCEYRLQTRDPAIDQEVRACLDFVRGCPFEVNISVCLRIALLIPVVRERLKPCFVGTCSDRTALDSCTASAYALD